MDVTRKCTYSRVMFALRSNTGEQVGYACEYLLNALQNVMMLVSRFSHSSNLN